MIFSSDKENSDCSENSESNDGSDDDDDDIDMYQQFHKGTFPTYDDKLVAKRKHAQDFLRNMIQDIHDSARKKK